MPLIFPASPSVGQTYQSGSSNTYEWTGTYWRIKNVQPPDTFAGILGNPQTLVNNLSIPDNYNALLVGDVTVDEDVIVSVGNNSVLKILDI